MPLPWLLFVIVFNNVLLLGAGAWFYFFVYAPRSPAGPHTAHSPDQTKKTLASLHQLTSEVTHRVERQVNHLDRAIAKLAARAADALHADDDSDGAPNQLLHQLNELGSFLTESTTRFQQLNSQLGNGASAAPLPERAVTETPQETIDARITEVRALAAQVQASQARYSGDRRQHRRDYTALPVTVVPLDEQMLPAGQEFDGVAREISTGGMSFSHSEPLDAPFVAVVMTPPDMQEICVVVESRHTQRVGPFYVTGGEFVCRMDDAPGMQSFRGQNTHRRQETATVGPTC